MIRVIGLGPGHPDYMLPAAKKAIDASDIVIAGKRNLRDLKIINKNVFEIKSDLEAVKYFMEKNKTDNDIAVAVSGDPCFYSILGYIRKNFMVEKIEVIPGISSFQYLFSKIGKPWENFLPASVHGRTVDVVELVRKNNNVFFLTDAVFSCERIASVLYENGLGYKTIYAGNNLSYENESIICEKAKIMKDMKLDFKLAIAAVTDE